MSPESEVIRKQLPEIAKIFGTECWLEGERRGRSVHPSDPVIQTRVADIILSGVGAALRQWHTSGRSEDSIAARLPIGD